MTDNEFYNVAMSKSTARLPYPVSCSYSHVNMTGTVKIV